MSKIGAAGTIVTHRAAGQPFAYERPAELVDISERVYRQVFGVGLLAASGFTGAAMVASLLQPPGSQLRGVVVCAACLLAVSAAAVRSATLYQAVRRHPWTLLIAGALLGAGALAVGPDNWQLLLPMAAVIGVIGVATPLRIVVVAGLLTAAGLGAPQVLDGREDFLLTIAVIVPPVMFWLIVERIASFALRFHQSVDNAATDGWSPPRERSGAASSDSGPCAAPSPPSSHREQPALPPPTRVSVGGTTLTSRQLQVVLLVCEGLRHAEVGACLGIGPQQVRRHLREARRRTGSDTTPQMVAWARRTGLAPSVGESRATSAR